MMVTQAADDKRFQHPAWRTPPFSLYRHGYPVMEAWGEAAAPAAPWLTPASTPGGPFWAHQWIDLFSPTNAPWTNPQVFEMRDLPFDAYPRMHSEYLRSMFLRNALAEGRYAVDGLAIRLGDIHAPLFVVSTETDHVAPWRSVYKLSHLAPAEFTFVLTSGGHNARIVSEPDHAHRHFRTGRRAEGVAAVGPDEWLDGAELCDGSWWSAWTAWLSARSGQTLAPPPRMGGAGTPDSMEAAPASYVMER
ncbi:MAG: Poly-beta-hydroxybutyrate polymerase domain protein [Sphingomonas bacterium]|nr:Poly-beta-hydroxybutyrate polymerase domain protein [Sphingomonas bacterium]